MFIEVWAKFSGISGRTSFTNCVLAHYAAKNLSIFWQKCQNFLAELSKSLPEKGSGLCFILWKGATMVKKFARKG